MHSRHGTLASWMMQQLESLVRVLSLISALTLSPHIAFADPQCLQSQPVIQSATATISDPITTSVSRPSKPVAQASEHGPDAPAVSSNSTGVPVLDHVIAAGAHVTNIGVSHGLRTAIARHDGQFVRLYVSADGQVAVAGLMADLSPADLLTMAPGQVTELGTFHDLRGMFVRNGGQFQVFYATPDDERVIPARCSMPKART